LLDLTFAEFKAAVEAFDPGDNDGLRDQPRRFRARVFGAGSVVFSRAFRADGPTLALGQVSMPGSTSSLPASTGAPPCPVAAAGSKT